MQDDQFESSNANAGNDTQRQHKHRKHLLDDEEHPHKRSRDRQKATAIALSVITCLFMCVIGYEIIRENTSKQDEPQANAEKSRPSLILSKMSLRDNSEYLADEDNDDTYENHQIRLLQDQNRKQANKIKALRQELLEKMQAMHDIKANLFKQEGDPRDKAKIADLSQKLDEKEKAVNNLSASMKAIENELASLQRKIEHAEVTRDALASMIETQRTAKEQERIIAQKQIEELRSAHHEESTQLKNSIAELEKTLLALDAAYKEKLEALEQVNQELANNYELLENKTQEHQSLAELHRETREMMTRQILDLIASLEWEAASKARITQSFQASLERLDLEKSAVINLLEAELQQRNEIIALKEGEENIHRNKMGFTANQAQEQVLNLIATLEFEMTRTSFLQQDLDRAVYVHRQKLDDKHAAISALEHDLKKQKLILESKGEELDNLWSVLNLTRDEHRQKINDLVASHELETLKVIELQQALGENNQEKEGLLQKHQNYLADLDLLKTTNTELTNQLALREQDARHLKNTRIQELEQIIAELKQNVEAKDNLLAARELELHALMASEAEAVQLLRQQASELAHQIETGNLQLVRMHEEILSLIPYKESQKVHIERIKQLDENISALNNDLAEKERLLAESQDQLQNAIQTHGSSDKQLQEHINNLSLQLETEALRLKQMDRDLQSSLQSQSDHEANLQRLDELQIISEAFKNELIEKEAQLAESQKELHNLNKTLNETEKTLKKQIDDLTIALNSETSKLTDLESELNQVTSSHIEGEQRNAELDAKLKIASHQASALEEKIKAYQNSLTTKEQEIEALIESKFTLEQNLIDQINDLEAQIAHEQNKTETFQHKFKERHVQHSEQKKQLQEFELQIGILNNQLYQKEKELLATEEKLLLTLPQIDLLSTENEHLQNVHGEFDKKVKESTQLIQTQQKQIQELVERLNEEQNLFKQALAEQEEQKRSSQQSAKKQELTALRAALLEDQLALNEAALRRYEEAVAKLEQKQSLLRDDYETQLEAAKAELEREKEFSKSLNKDNQRLVADYLHQQDNAEKMQYALELSNENITKLENEIQALRETLAMKDEKLNQNDKILNQNKHNEGTIAQLKQNLENEKQKNRAIEADLKKIISAYNAERQKQKENSKHEPVAER